MDRIAKPKPPAGVTAGDRATEAIHRRGLPGWAIGVMGASVVSVGGAATGISGGSCWSAGAAGVDGGSSWGRLASNRMGGVRSIWCTQGI